MRRKRPTRVMRGSRAILNTGPSASFRCAIVLALAVGVLHHRAQLVERERAAAAADARRAVEHRAARLELDEHARARASTGAHSTSATTASRRRRARACRSAGRRPADAGVSNGSTGAAAGCAAASARLRPGAVSAGARAGVAVRVAIRRGRARGAGPAATPRRGPLAGRRACNDGSGLGCRVHGIVPSGCSTCSAASPSTARASHLRTRGCRAPSVPLSVVVALQQKPRGTTSPLGSSTHSRHPSAIATGLIEYERRGDNQDVSSWMRVPDPPGFPNRSGGPVGAARPTMFNPVIKESWMAPLGPGEVTELRALMLQHVRFSRLNSGSHAIS